MKPIETISNRLGRLSVVTSILFILAFAPKNAIATDCYWSGLGGGSWNIDQPGNWFSGIPNSGTTYISTTPVTTAEHQASRLLTAITGRCVFWLHHYL